MPPKHLKLDMDHNVIDRRDKAVARVKAWTEPSWLTEYRYDRDLVIAIKFGYPISDADRKYIIEKYNIRFDLFGGII